MQVALGPEAEGSVVLDGSGNGTVQVGPISPRETWSPSLVSVSASSNTKEANCKIYVGKFITGASFVDATLSGSSGDSSASIGAFVIPVGWYVFAVWTGGDSGAVATLNVSGTKVMQ